MTKSRSFAPVADARARVLVLGSLPGRASLAQQQYYALPRNAFWRLMGEMFGFAHDAAYDCRLACLREHGVALWDVCHSARRDGSLDSAIEHGSVRANDFDAFFRKHPGIGAIFFNGATAARLYETLVLPSLPAALRQQRRSILPSTSPAHAARSYAEKLHRWSEVRAAAGGQR